MLGILQEKSACIGITQWVRSQQGRPLNDDAEKVLKHIR